MYEYLQIIIQIRLGLRDREIARTGLAGRKKCKDVRAKAQHKGWLGPNTPIPTEDALNEVFGKSVNKSPQSAVAPHHELMSKASQLQ